MLVDTHCHIHESNYPLDADEVLGRAREAEVTKVICVGTDLESSVQAVKFANSHNDVFAAIGIHPHETKGLEDGKWNKEFNKLLHSNSQIPSSSLVAIGEIGLDYFYEHSPRDIQIAVFKTQLQLAVEYDLPVIFHVRDQAVGAGLSSVWDDFWPIFDSFTGIRGVLHSFTDNQVNLDAAINRGLYIGINGISTFTKISAQQQLFANIPLDNLLLETDAPFLTPQPLRGRINESAYVRYVAEHQASIRKVSFEKIATATTTNAHALFAL
ncbi:MAG: TatD family hydrolase [Candidatus Saccharimonadales bacterium]